VHLWDRDDQAATHRPRAGRWPTTVKPLLAHRLAAQLLAGNEAPTPEAVVERLLAVQAQDARAFRLAIRSRTRASHVDDLEAALTQRRSLVVTWLNRGTLHLVTAADYRWLHPLTTPQLATGNVRRLREEGVSPVQAAQAVAAVVEAVARGPRTRSQLASALAAAGAPSRGQALVHVLMRAALEGRVVRGPVLDGEHAYVAVDDWLGPAPAPMDRAAALGRLARRYLTGHGPAAARDLAKWAGISLRDATAGLAAIEAETESFGDDLIALPGAAAPTSSPPRLLGAWDPLLLGWASRALVTADHDPAIVSGGVFRPFAIENGRAVATWRLVRGRVVLEPLQPIDVSTRRALDADAEAVRRYLRPPP
jgi:hypothetical protein